MNKETSKSLIGPITPYNQGYLDGIEREKKHPSKCPICKGSPCVLKGTPEGQFISGAHSNDQINSSR